MIHENVTVVIPCYNVSDCIGEAVHLLLDSDRRIPLVLVDNASTDNTMDVLESLKKNFPHIIIESESKKGACAARNKGLSLVQTPFVKFLDADDLVLASALELQWKEMSSSTSDILFSPFEKRKVSGESTVIEPLKDVWKGLFTTRLGLTSAILFSTNAVKKVGGWNENIQSSQEYDLIFRLLQARAKYTFSSSKSAVVRERENGQISTGNPIPRWTNYLNLRRSILTHLQEQETAYFLREKDFFLQAYFDVLHIVYPYLPSEASSEYRRVIKGKYTPQTSPACSSLFIKLLSIFGFDGAERIKKILGK